MDRKRSTNLGDTPRTRPGPRDLETSRGSPPAAAEQSFSPVTLPTGPGTCKTRVCFTVDPGFLAEWDSFCTENGKNRSYMICRSMRGLMDGAILYMDLKRSRKEDSK